MTTKEIVEEFIAKGNTKRALEHCIKDPSGIGGKRRNELLLFSNRWKSLEREKQKGTLSESDFAANRNKITLGLLDLLSEYEIERTNSDKNLNFTQTAINRIRILSENDENYRFKCNEESVQSAIEFHKKKIDSWARLIEFKETKKAKSIFQVYVDLDYYITPRSQNMVKSHDERIKLEEVLSLHKNQHLIIMGQPGAGKTTTMKKLSIGCLENAESGATFSFPLVVRLRELNNILVEGRFSRPLMNYILATLGINVIIDFDIIGKTPHSSDISLNYYSKLISRLTIQLLEDLNVLLILDGFDELSLSLRNSIILDIKEFSENLNKTQMILTTRTGEFPYTLQKSSEFEISALTKDQIQSFISKWVKDKVKSKELYRQIVESPFADTAIRPLTLAHLCALYEKYSLIPEKPKSIYKKIINLLLEEWDSQRAISRKSRYSNFEIDRKFEFLASIAFKLTTEFNASVFTRDQIEYIYHKICDGFGLPVKECDLVLAELETHNGLFLRSGYETYEFAHKSLQEFLTADYIVKLPEMPSQLLTLEYPNEMALAIAISSNPTLYFASVGLKFAIKSKKPTSQFIESFFNRLIVEKPDFTKEAVLAVSFLNLYASCVMISGGNVICRFGEEQFLEFSRIPVVRTTLRDLIKNNYRIRKEYDNGVLDIAQKISLAREFGFTMPINLLIDRRFFE